MRAYLEWTLDLNRLTAAFGRRLQPGQGVYQRGELIGVVVVVGQNPDDGTCRVRIALEDGVTVHAGESIYLTDPEERKEVDRYVPVELGG